MTRVDLYLTTVGQLRPVIVRINAGGAILVNSPDLKPYIPVVGICLGEPLVGHKLLRIFNFSKCLGQIVIRFCVHPISERGFLEVFYGELQTHFLSQVYQTETIVGRRIPFVSFPAPFECLFRSL